MSKFYAIRAGSICSFTGALLLMAMVIVGISTSAELAQLSQQVSPEAYAKILRPIASVVIWVTAVDNLFLIGYTGAFVGTAILVWQPAPFFGGVGLGFGILTAALDLLENAVTVSTARAVLAGSPITTGQLALLSVVGQVKYAGAGLALLSFAIALVVASPGRRPMTLIVAALFSLFPVVNAVTLVNPGAVPALLLWMLLSLLAGSVLLWRTAQAFHPGRANPGG